MGFTIKRAIGSIQRVLMIKTQSLGSNAGQSVTAIRGEVFQGANVNRLIARISYANADFNPR